MKILTLNTWNVRGPWQKRWEIILQGIQSYRPDIIGFQELFDPEWAKHIQKKAHYPFIAISNASAGLVFLSRHKILTSQCLQLATQSPTEDYKRFALFAELSLTRQRIAIFNTHLSWKLNESPIRQRQVLELLNFIDWRAAGKLTWVMGDFNSIPQSPEIKSFLHRGRMTDLYQKRHPYEKGWTWDNKNPFAAGSSVLMPNRRIDYIFMRAFQTVPKIKSVQLLYTKPAGGIYASDHFGILATLNL